QALIAIIAAHGTKAGSRAHWVAPASIENLLKEHYGLRSEKLAQFGLQPALRVRHMSVRTEKAYSHWIRQYVLFHGKRHPAETGEVEINAFLTHLLEGLRLRVKGVDFSQHQITVRDGKG